MCLGWFILKNLKYITPPPYLLPSFININFVVHSAIPVEFEQEVVKKFGDWNSWKAPKSLKALKVNELIVREDLFVWMFLNKLWKHTARTADGCFDVSFLRYNFYYHIIQLIALSQLKFIPAVLCMPSNVIMRYFMS